MFKNVLKKVVGDPVERALSKYRERVAVINALEPEMKALSDADLRAIAIGHPVFLVIFESKMRQWTVGPGGRHTAHQGKKQHGPPIPTIIRAIHEATSRFCTANLPGKAIGPNFATRTSF